MSFYDLDENSPTIKHPKGLKVKLRPHQLTSIAAMRELEKQGSIVIDKPDIASGLYTTVRFILKDVEEFTGSTFVVETNSAILADKVGSGKTFMVIGLILNTPIPAVHDRFIIGTDHFSIKMMSIKESEPVNLIVVPHNLANQWADFVEQSSLEYLKLNTISDFDIFFDIDYVTKQETVPNCPLVIYNVSRKKDIPDKKIKKKGGSKTNNTKIKKGTIVYERKMLNPKKVADILAEKKVFILNVNRYKFFKQIFRSTKWARVIIDEMDSASIPNMFDEFGNFNWFLTATPTSIFYKSCRRYVNKIFSNHQHLLKYFIVKNKDEYVDTSVVLPKPYVYMINTLLHRVVSAIQDLIPQDVMQLINAGNMKEAVSKLNCNIDTEENIIKILTDKINTELHNLTKELEYVNSLIPADQDAHEKRIKNLEIEIQRCKTKLETVKERVASINEECCFICADAFDTPTIVNCCKSVYCLKCLLPALKMGGNKCPYCRQTIKNNKEYHIISSKPDKKKKIVEKKKTMKGFDEMDKADVLENILMYISKNDPSPKILIFSDYSQTFDKIVKNIAKANLQYALLSGVPAHITNVINEFHQGITNILMLDSQHYGSGLNLQDANYLILYHRMTPELETQVIGRAQRFGRKIPLKIIYLVNDSENKTTKLTNNPYNLQAADELWMVTDPPQQNGDALIDEDDEDNDENTKRDKSENQKTENQKTKNQKTKNQKTKNQKTNKSVKNTKNNLKDDISDADDDVSDADDDDTDVVVKRKTIKSKKNTDVDESDELSDVEEVIVKKTKKTTKNQNNKKTNVKNKKIFKTNDDDEDDDIIEIDDDDVPTNKKTSNKKKKTKKYVDV
ncbi:NAD-dependent DNA ligase [Tupanvirus deep ocean]|uniref:NAD-dependent DNA ligase n=2 Tax=Tupanvirus TaxID=2094720 RepID=A0AC62A743_9VIRU|nr:NAD-dependent DNA ligase [Tupanvirus deep ocean]QKU33605.1 NAD-dependent DNA ligase [Tupanvirus deep ocean]